MSFWYLPPQKGQSHALIGTKQWSSVNTKIEFKEAVAKETDDFWLLLMDVTAITPSDIRGIGDTPRDWKFEPQLCLLKFAKKDYERKGEQIKQSVPEKLFCKLLSELEQGKAYKGFIKIQDSPQALCIADGSGMIGNTQVPESILGAFKDELSRFEVVENPTVDISILDSIGNKSGGFQQKKAETEQEKLNARVAFINEQYKLAFQELEVKCLHDVYKIMTGDNETIRLEASELWNLIIQMIK